MARNPLKTNHYEKIMEHLEHDQMRHTTKNKLKKAFTALYYTGARINEIARLKVKDIKQIITHGEIKLLTTKTKRFKDGEFRTVPFSDTAREVIKDVFKHDLESNPEDYVIKSWNNGTKMVNISTLDNQLNKYLDKAFPDMKLTTHSFRAGIITEMILDNEVHPTVVQKFIGHKNLSTTNIYIKPTDEDVKNSLIR
jgi:integrase